MSQFIRRTNTLTDVSFSDALHSDLTHDALVPWGL